MIELLLVTILRPTWTCGVLLELSAAILPDCSWEWVQNLVTCLCVLQALVTVKLTIEFEVCSSMELLTKLSGL